MPDTVQRASDTKMNKSQLPCSDNSSWQGRERSKVSKSHVITLLRVLLWRHREGVGCGGTVKESFIEELKIEQELMELRKLLGCG